MVKFEVGVSEKVAGTTEVAPGDFRMRVTCLFSNAFCCLSYNFYRPLDSKRQRNVAL